MIIEQKVIAMIEESADFVTVPAEASEALDTIAVDFVVSGSVASDIPEAKYDEGQSGSLPTKKERD